MDPVPNYVSNCVPSNVNMAVHVDKNAGICSHSHRKPTLDFSRSATVNHLIKWRDEYVNKIDNGVILSKAAVVKAESKLEKLAPDDWLREEIERDLEFDKRRVVHFTKIKSDMLALGDVFQSEEQIKSMTTFIFKRPLTDSEWKTFWPMIQREAKYSADYYVMYTAHDKNTEVRLINHHINNSPAEHLCGKECFTRKTFRNIDKLEFKTLTEAYEKHIFTKSFFNDHDEKIIAHFLCMNLSLFANFGTSESTMERFLARHTVSCIPPVGSATLNAKIKSLQAQEHQVLEQIFIKKDVAIELGYVSSPYGFPLASDSANLAKSTPQILNAYQGEHKVDLDAIHPKYMMSTQQAMQSGSSRISNPISTQEYIKDMNIPLHDLQYRLIYIPELYNDGSSVLVFSNTMDDGHVTAEHMRAVLNKELMNTDSLLSLLKPNLVNKIVGYLYQ